jgi:hypothetical protein
MNCLRSLESWCRGFESHSRHGYLCVRLFCVCVVLYVGKGLATGWSPVQGVLPSVCRITKLNKQLGPNTGLKSHCWMNEWNGWMVVVIHYFIYMLSPMRFRVSSTVLHRVFVIFIIESKNQEWSLFENFMLRKIFVPKIDDITWHMLKTFIIYSLHIELLGDKWKNEMKGHTAHSGWDINIIICWKPQRRNHLEDLG